MSGVPSVPVRIAADGSVVVSVHVQPGAKRTEFAGRHGEALKIRLAAPPVDGKANACLQAFLADFLNVPKAAIELVSGQTSRQKVLRVSGADASAATRLMDQLR